MSDILKRYATENFFDRTWPNFLELLERGAFSHTAFPGWLLIRSACVTCDEPVTVIKYHGERYELVPSGDNQMGKRWVIHQCPGEVLDQFGADDDKTEREQSISWVDRRESIGPDEGHPQDERDAEYRALQHEYGEAEDIAEAEAEAKGEVWPDDPEVRDGDGNIRSGGWND